MLNTYPEFIAIDFFCGAVGTTRGLIDAGGYVAAGVDNASDCLETFENNNINLDGSKSKYLQRDIFEKSETYPSGEQDVLVGEIEDILLPLRQKYPKAPTLFSICAPCQPFTNLSRGELSEARSESRIRDRNLLEQSLNFISHFDPDLIFCENVAGIQNKKYGGVWGEFLSKLEALGYVTGSTIANTMNFGVPQMRKRSIILAVRKSNFNGLNSTITNGMDAIKMPENDGTGVVRTVRDVISHLPPIAAGETHPVIKNHKCSNLSDINMRRISMLEPGQSNIAFEGTDMQLACHTRVRTKKNSKKGFSDSYTRMSNDKPAPTITTKCFSFSNGRFGHPDVKQNRALSVREAAAIQTFPDNYEFYASSIQKSAKMVGNAVPPLLATFFALELVKMFKEKEIEISKAA